jgi:endonuclease/exonuclease/phosphatase (EEP) superfamily protein YafD
MDRDRLIGALVWTCVGAWAAFALVRLFGLERGFPLVPLLAFTPWIAAASVIPVALAAALRRWRALAVALATVALLGALVLPRAFGGATHADGGAGATLRVLAANVEFGEARGDQLVALGRKLEIDALVVTELTQKFAAVLRRAGVDELLPHSVLSPEPNARGTGIYSRLRPSQRAVEHLPGGFALPHAQLEPVGAQSVTLFGIHTVPPTESDAWPDDLEAVPSPSPTTPTILAGDFNATLDHAEFRELLDRGYADAAETLGDGLKPTWPTNRRFPPLFAIDHVLADERIGIRAFSAHDLDGTDHRAVFAELELPAGLD